LNDKRVPCTCVRHDTGRGGAGEALRLPRWAHFHPLYSFTLGADKKYLSVRRLVSFVPAWLLGPRDELVGHAQREWEREWDGGYGR